MLRVLFYVRLFFIFISLSFMFFFIHVFVFQPQCLGTLSLRGDVRNIMLGYLLLLYVY
jgi:hypothetical protein